MRLAFRIASSATSRPPSLLQIGPAVTPAVSLSRGKQICTRFSSTESKSVAKGTVKNAPSPLPSPPPPSKGTPPTITTRDIEEYVQPLYLRGWGLCPILPNGNGIAVLRKRFDFARAGSLEQFLADLNEYEEKEQHHAKTNVFGDQHAVLVSTWTHVARRPNIDENIKTQGVTARDIHLAYALEKLFESALAEDGGVYDPRVRPGADRPTTIKELDGYD